MKAAPFDYARPATVAEAVAALAEAGDEGKVLAGGQSLVPVLAMRLGRPAVLVDINAVVGLDELSLGDDTLYVGATVRQRRLEQDPLTAAVPLLGHGPALGRPPRTAQPRHRLRQPGPRRPRRRTSRRRRLPERHPGHRRPVRAAAPSAPVTSSPPP